MSRSTAMIHDRIGTLQTAVGVVFSERSYQTLGVATFLGTTTLYAFTLPATYTGGRIGLVSLRLLTPTLAMFALVMATLVALIVSFMGYTVRIGGSASTAATTTGVLGGILPPLLCCSPLLPTIAAVVVGVFPAAFGVSGAVQGFVATYETEILSVATLVLLYATMQNARGVTRCSV